MIRKIKTISILSLVFIISAFFDDNNDNMLYLDEPSPMSGKLNFEFNQ